MQDFIGKYVFFFQLIRPQTCIVQNLYYIKALRTKISSTITNMQTTKDEKLFFDDHHYLPVEFVVSINENQDELPTFVCVEVYSSVNPMGSCRARSVYLTTLLLGRLSPLSG